MKEIKKINKYTKELLDKKGVVGIGTVGSKITKGKVTDIKARRIYVDKKKPLDLIDSKDRIPHLIKGVPSDVISIGEIKILSLMEKQESLFSRITTFIRKVCPFVVNRKGKVRPIKGSYSEGNCSGPTGTGSILIKTTNNPFKSNEEYVVGSVEPNTIYRMSNAHVLCEHINKDVSKQRRDTLQPGVADSGTMDDVTGRLESHVRIEEGYPVTVDTALRSCLETESPVIEGLGTPKGFINFEEGNNIVKAGRTTNITKGNILDSSVTLQVNYGGFTGTIMDCMLTTRMSAGGDSGSCCLIDDGSMRVGGLIFAGSPSHSCLIAMKNIRKIWGFNLVGSEPQPPTEKEYEVSFLVSRNSNGENYRVYGDVRNKITNEPVGSSAITLDDEVVSTDSEGLFEFKEVKPGTYNISFHKTGYVKQDKIIILK